MKSATKPQAARPEVSQRPTKPQPDIPAVNGLLELYGFHEPAGVWIFAGWIAHSATPAETQQYDAMFDLGTLSAEAQMAFYPREDLGERGVGFIVALAGRRRRLGRLLRLEYQIGQASISIVPVDGVRELADRGLADAAAEILFACSLVSDVSATHALLARRFVGEGYIDVVGFHAPSGGWLVCGWVSYDWLAHRHETVSVDALFDAGHVVSSVVQAFYERADLGGKGLGTILYFKGGGVPPDRLLRVTLRAGDAVVVLTPTDANVLLPADQMVPQFRGLIGGAQAGPERDQLLQLISRAAYDGGNTLEPLADRVLVGLDEVVDCTPDSIVVFGWLLARPGALAQVTLRSARHRLPLDLDAGCVWHDRPDVIETIGRQHGYDDPRCGFLARVPCGAYAAGELYLEVETSDGAIGFRPVPRPQLTGISAIKRVLGELDPGGGDIDRVHDHVTGPAVAALGARQRATAPRVQTLSFGSPPARPEYSVVIPLYGRIDFIEVQLALFATLGIGADAEILYVLDDPPRLHEARTLAASAHARFRVPFRLLCLSRNVGFAPASNIGARAAAGRFVCFMNSDVFPTGGDWLPRLAAHLDRDPYLGAVGPLLLFEDGSVQHQGIAFKTLPAFGDWSFPQHPRKGMRARGATGLVPEIAITGACMMLRRDDLAAHGPFDEAFVVGDFEDTDLCLRLRQRGLGSAVDHGVTMHHLERRSQASSAHRWRMNLTLHNAWVHQRRWADTLRALRLAA